MNLSTFLKKLTTLRVAGSRALPAPHKALLLLSVMQMMEYGEIRENMILISPELVARFKDNWYALVHNWDSSPNFSLPFYHLKSSGFWHLQTFPGKEILLTSSNSIRSFAALKEAVAYAYFDDEVYELLQDAHNRDLAKQALVATYLGGQPARESPYGLFDKVAEQMLCESPAEYRLEIAKADEEELFVRGGVFKKVVPKVYNYTVS